MKVKCVDVSVNQVEFYKRMERKLGEHEVLVSLEPEYAVKDEEEIKSARLTMKVEVGEKDLDDFPFYFMMELAGIFSWEDLTEKEAEEDIMTDGIEMLMSFVRTYLYDVMGKAHVGQFIMPLKHFSIEELQQTDSNREIQEDKDGN